MITPKSLFVTAILAVSSKIEDVVPPIVGGFTVDISEVPYQVSLRYKGMHVCGGSILSDHVIVTAAHCLFFLTGPQSLTIAAGSSTRIPMSGQEFQVARYILHPLYELGTYYDYDVAIMILAGQLSFNDRIQPIALCESLPMDGTKALVSGWGHLVEGGSSGNSNELQAAEVDIFPNSKCSAGYGDVITERMVCAGVEEGGIDACQNDSGGPLVVDGELLGIVSWGKGCAQKGFPGVYSSIPSLRSWIIETVKNNSINLL